MSAQKHGARHEAPGMEHNLQTLKDSFVEASRNLYNCVDGFGHKLEAPFSHPEQQDERSAELLEDLAGGCPRPASDILAFVKKHPAESATAAALGTVALGSLTVVLAPGATAAAIGCGTFVGVSSALGAVGTVAMAGVNDLNRAAVKIKP